jgi:hypothetical protein
MAFKIVFATIAFFAVSFLTRFLVALLKEAALGQRRDRPQPVVVGHSDYVVPKRRKLSRLTAVGQNEIRLIPMAKF